jgi:pimeloyl-ACP methyl ester carboxylesterase
MPYAHNQGVRIHYQVIGKGPSLILHHGFLGSLDEWDQFGYVEGLEEDYQLLMIDARGHGASDKPHDPQAYGMALRVADVVAVLDDLGIDKAHFWGYSMGGWVGFGIAQYAPERLCSTVLGAADAREGDPDAPDPLLELCKAGMETVLGVAERAFGQWWTPELKAKYAANDLEALTAYRSLKEQGGLEDNLPAMTMPNLLYVSEGDSRLAAVKRCSEAMPNATFVSFPGPGHIQTFCRSDLVLPHVREFLAKVRRA